MAAFRQSSAVVAVPGTAVALSAVSLPVRSFDIMAKKVTGANTGVVYLGNSTVDYATNQGIKLVVDAYWEKHAPPGDTIDLAEVYIDADTAGDGVVFNYYI